MSGFCPNCGESFLNNQGCQRCAGQLGAGAQAAGEIVRPVVAGAPAGAGAAALEVAPQALPRVTPVGAPKARQVSLPKASIARRLLGSGIEYLAYSMTIAIFSFFGFFTGGLLGLVWVPLVFVLVALRDLNGGAFSPGKRVGNLRVVDLRSARPASNFQALARNGYYLGLVLLMIVPLLKYLVQGFFFLFLVVDVMMIVASPGGRRLGDYLAGTQVVPMSESV